MASKKREIFTKKKSSGDEFKPPLPGRIGLKMSSVKKTKKRKVLF